MTRVIFAFLILLIMPPYSIAQDIPLTNEEMIALGMTSDEHAELVSKIKKDLKLEDVQVKVLIGSYNEKVTSTGRLLNDLPNGYYVLIDRGFYEGLIPTERDALIAHEMGHIQYTIKVHVYDLEASAVQVSADIFAIKYVGIDAVLSFLDKTCTEDDRDNIDCKLRTAVLKYIKQAF